MSKNINACLSSKSDNWRTPSKLYDYFIKMLGFVDTFPYCSMLDQYEIMYDNDNLFMNPPYSHLTKGYLGNYIFNLLLRGNVIYLLIPVRTDTQYFRFLFQYCSCIVFFTGRLHFNDSKSAPFPSMLMILSYDYYLNRDINHTFVKSLSVDEFIRIGINHL